MLLTDKRLKIDHNSIFFLNYDQISVVSITEMSIHITTILNPCTSKETGYKKAEVLVSHTNII